MKLGTRSLIKYLISKGADINSKTNDGETPLHLSILAGIYTLYLDIFELLNIQIYTIKIHSSIIGIEVTTMLPGC